ncbi:sugar transferase [Armatimonas rosea]|uniref:O-antigen biosynthesis protein WbqP n=1 Tax=Armatimonas rosea TaxID=685828 RepID=A0A7W9SWN6_ARMRO|nr:O-antigen biosynthesis protein WbqP [Armatimonas rosea]
MRNERSGGSVRTLYPALIKRLADFGFALLGLVFLTPLWLLLALLIRLDSPGPVLFRQRRVGRGGHEFVLLKFRSMRTDTPNLSTAELRASGLEPYTRVGTWLRKTSVDEQPQLWNVLRGEMSIIGPRPALPSQTELNADREARGVHALRPGITGWAQVNGRDNLTDDEKVRFDAEYLERQSLGFDLWILWRTLAEVATARGNK